MLKTANFILSIVILSMLIVVWGYLAVLYEQRQQYVSPYFDYFLPCLLFTVPALYSIVYRRRVEQHTILLSILLALNLVISIVYVKVTLRLFWDVG